LTNGAGDLVMPTLRGISRHSRERRDSSGHFGM